MRVQPLRSTLSSALAGFLIFITMAAGTLARGGEAPATKEQDVITVGTGPYTGPTAAELAKLAMVQHESSVAPSEAKARAVSTIGPARSPELTPAQLAKLQTLLQALPAPPPEMVKLPPIEVPKDGIPEMTAQEREKLAEITAHGGSIGEPAGDNGGEVAPVGQRNEHGVGATAPVTGQGSHKAVSTTPQKATGSDR